jgi:hypothetical protein
MTPKLKVGINKDFDKIICFKFLNRKKAGIDFGEGIIKVHPELEGVGKMDPDAQKDLINKYFDKFYEDHEEEIEKTREVFTRDWSEIQTRFFEACSKYFGSIGWPEGRYIAFLSIISCNPRFLEDKTFQVYWKNKKGFVPVASHELLHFLFFHTLSTYHPSVDIKSDDVWRLSEAFNILILREQDFVEITNDSEPKPYPELIKLTNELAPIWEKTKTVKIFLEQSLKLVGGMDY